MKSIDAPVVRAVQIVLAGFAIAMLLSGIMAAAFGRHLVTALQGAGVAAAALRHGKTPDPTRTLIVEVDALNQSLARSGEVLEAEREAREARAEQAATPRRRAGER